MKLIPKFVARRPVIKVETYCRKGLYVERATRYYCPHCSHIQSAGPNYQPRYCDRCGQKINFDGIEWKETEFIGYAFEEKMKIQRQRENALAGIVEEDT